MSLEESMRIPLYQGWEKKRKKDIKPPVKYM